ncbi:hypothetical protein ACOMHN_010423 [Nucella lapillus]
MKMLAFCLLVFVVTEGTQAWTVTKAPTNTSAALGQNANLTCTVTQSGQNSDSVKWFKGGNSNALTLNGLPVSNDGHYLVSGTYDLVIVNLALQDQAQYTCNVGGTDYHAFLTVVDLPVNLSVYWTEGPQVGPVSNLTCMATRAHPPSVLSWSRNGVPLQDSRIVYTANADQNTGYGEAVSVLPLSLRSQDEGAVFRCEASYNDWREAMTANLTLSFSDFGLSCKM